MDFKQYDTQKGDFFNTVFHHLPVHLKNEMREAQKIHKDNPQELTFRLMILNWAASIVKRRLSETQMYEERDAISNTAAHTNAEFNNQEYARLAYTWAILYRRFLDKKIAAQHTDIISMATRDMMRLATRIRNGLRR